VIWLLYYLITVIVVPTTYAMLFVVTHHNPIQISYGFDVLIIVIKCLLWPILVPYDIATNLKKTRLGNLKSRGNSIVRRHRIGENTQDLSNMAVIPESELKLVLKAFRKKAISLSHTQVNMIRDELINRVTERTLLK
jgi:hypothetical protein